MPNRFIPIPGSTSQEQMLAMINRNFAELDNEGVTKVFKGQGGKNAIVEGKLPYQNGFGSLFYDANGVPRIVLGLLPDGTMGMVVSREDVDVLTLFS